MLKSRLTSELIKQTPQYLLIFTLVVVDLMFRSGPINRRMATASFDDNPITYFLVRNNPEAFKYDIYARVLADTQQNSIVSHIGFFLLHNNFVTTEIFWICILSFQRGLLYIAVFKIVQKISNSQLKATIAVVLFSTTSIYYVNLGWFGALDDQPYPMWLALPFTLLSIYYLNSNAIGKGIACSLTAVLIHPTLGLAFLGWIVFHSLLVKNWKNFKRFFLTLMVGLAFVSFGKIRMPEQAAVPAEIKSIMLTNDHLDFFNIFSTNYTMLSLRVWVLVICFTLIAVIQANKCLGFIKGSYIALMGLYALLLLLIQQIGLWSNNFLLISLVPARFTTLLITLTYVIVISIAINKMFDSSFFEKVSIFLFLLFPSPVITICYLLQVSLSYSKNEKIIKLKILTHLFIIINILFLVLQTFIPSIIQKYSALNLFNDFFNRFLNPLSSGFMNYIISALISNVIIQILLFSSLALIIVQGKQPITSRIEKWNRFLPLTWILQTKTSHYILIFSIVTANISGMSYQRPFSFNGVEVAKVDSYVDAQEWARFNTTPESVFFIDGAMLPYYSWRTYSQRPISNPSQIWSLYNYPKYAAEFNDKRNEFWSDNVENGSIKSKGEINEAYFCLSQPLMRIKYVVRSAISEKMNFPLAYTNDFFDIYKVKCE